MNDYPTDPTLTPLLRERQFYAAILIGLPALAYAYVQIVQSIWHGDPIDTSSVTLSLSANPVVLYLIARQYARGKASAAVGVALSTLPGPIDPTTEAITVDDQIEAQEVLHTGTISVRDDGERGFTAGDTDPEALPND